MVEGANDMTYKYIVHLVDPTVEPFYGNAIGFSSFEEFIAATCAYGAFDATNDTWYPPHRIKKVVRIANEVQIS